MLIVFVFWLATWWAKVGTFWRLVHVLCVFTLDAYALRVPMTRRQPTAWPWIAFTLALGGACEFAEYLGRRHAERCLGIAHLLLFMWLLWGGGGGWAKKLGGRLLSAGLTAINKASFRRQTAEAA